MWTAVRAGRSWRGEIVNRRKSGEIYVVAQNVTPLLDENQVLTHLVAAHEDVTAHRQAETRIEHMAHHDGLTDLPNRTHFATRLQAAIVQAESDGGSVGVLFVDLDRFKLINETFGHLMGDQILREVAARLKSSVRDLDMVARFDGDEFTILLPGSDRGVATLVAERVLASLGHPVRIGGHDLAITASIGIALSSPEVRDADALLKRADAAMYQAKEVGRNGYAFFRDGASVRQVPTFTIQSGLRRALANGELALHYQPQMSACGRRLTGVEALLRWTSPTLGVVSPGDFIPVAEQTGIIVDIDRWVIRAACAQAKAWLVAGIAIPRVAVNVSGVSFRRGQLVSWIDDALAEAQLPPGYLEIELTEGVLMHDAALVIETLASLRKVGVRLALDDFGTGYSSLGYLKRFKLDVLKIDRSFISGLPDDPDSVAIARLIVAMAKALRLETVAEGVETREQAMFLEGLGCDTLQGFLFSRAVSPAEMSRFADGPDIDDRAPDAARLPAHP
jgi:diguanylate cyclase (GGDEF)-like protein